MEQVGVESMLAVAQVIKQLVQADLPVGDPAVDPDPSYALRDHVDIDVVGNMVTITVEGPYAVKLHEAQQFRHPRGGKAKFLERNVTVGAGLVERELATRAQVAMQTRRV